MKQRNKNSLPTTNGRTFRFYLPVKLYDKLIEESVKQDIAVSRLLRKKLELLDKISFLVLKKTKWLGYAFISNYLLQHNNLY